MGVQYFGEDAEQEEPMGRAMVALLDCMVARYEVYTQLIELEFRPPRLSRRASQERCHGR